MAQPVEGYWNVYSTASPEARNVPQVVSKVKSLLYYAVGQVKRHFTIIKTVHNSGHYQTLNSVPYVVQGFMLLHNCFSVR